MGRSIEELKKLYRVELPADSPYTEDDLWDMLGDPEIAEETSQRFAADHRAVDAMIFELLERHPYKWIVFYDGHLRAVEETSTLAFERIQALGLPRGEVVVRYLNPKPDTWRL